MTSESKFQPTTKGGAIDGSCKRFATNLHFPVHSFNAVRPTNDFGQFRDPQSRHQGRHRFEVGSCHKIIFCRGYNSADNCLVADNFLDTLPKILLQLGGNDIHRFALDIKGEDGNAIIAYIHSYCFTHGELPYLLI